MKILWNRAIFAVLFITAFTFLFQSCITASAASESSKTSSEKTDVQKKLVEGANWAKGRTSLIVNGRRFNLDCSGVVCAIYYYAGIDLTSDFAKYSGNGVKRIHQYLYSKNLLYSPKTFAPGDILFWDNTYDFDKDGKADDSLTHVGMIVSSDKKNGSAVYVHYNYSKGIIFEKINMLRPNNENSNSPIRLKNLPRVDGYKHLSSQLLHDAGKGYLLKK